MSVVRKILFPVVPIYFLVTWLRNLCYDFGILKSKSYDFPTLCVGNLSVGGTGKTPMIEYLIKLLKYDYNIATLSRGYKRNTKGFYIADQNSSALKIGDEPFQFYEKFNDIVVSVDSNRQNGIEQLIQLQNKPEVILLDDAFQHRKIKAGLNILLTTYDKLYCNDIMLPTGNLREPISGAKRAEIIVVTKCPLDLNDIKKNEIISRLKLLSKQNIFFSTIKYSETVFSNQAKNPTINLKKKKFTLVTGIANPEPIVNFFKKNRYHFEHLNFKDHHNFSENEIKMLKKKSLILTTEKDYMRLKDTLNSTKLYYLPIEMEVLEGNTFNKLIHDYLKTY